MALHRLYCCIGVLLSVSSVLSQFELANICDLLLCENGGTCVTDGDDGFCQCRPGFSGYRCEHDTNLCEPNPCFNSGTCVLDEHGVIRRCLCRPGFFGENCERGPCGKECSPKYQPVCGSDGYTYQNGCELEKSSCIDHTLICASIGECPARGCRCKCMPIRDPVCGTDCITYENECELNNARKCAKPSLRKSYHGDCRAFTCGLRKPYKCNTCLRLTGPVCGSDGKEYSSECQLRVKACKKKDLHMVRCGPKVFTNGTCARPIETENMITFINLGVTVNQVRMVQNRGQVEFTCLDGYSLYGEYLITCVDGEFEPKIPKCYKLCDEDPIKNGRAIGSFEHETGVQFECDRGYTREGPPMLTCLNGRYDGNLPICQANCDDPGKLLNGNVLGVFSHGAILSFSCNDGFTIIGSDLSTCVDGIWTSDKPRCHANCKPVTMTSELSSAGGIEHGMSLQFECSQGFTMYGESTTKCTNGAWSSPAPICLAGCQPPSKIDNGRFEGTFDHGGRIVIFCDDGYSIFGSNIISCIDGELSANIPVCRKNCQSIALQEFRVHRGQYTHGSVITFSCIDDRDLYGASEITCEDGVYSDELPNCYAKCAPVVTPEYGLLKGTNDHGQTLSFSCQDGYKLVGEKSVKCFDGVYSGDVPPICYENCNDLVLPNGEIEGVPEHENTLVFKCNEDFTLIGRLSAFCSDGVLSNDLPECKRNCFPFEFPNGKYVGSITHGNEISFSCNDGFSLVGASRLECVDGLYSAIIPACYESCNELVEPLNGYIVGDATHGEAVEYQCYAGYSLVGPSTRTCTDGSWDSLAPTCHENCDPIYMLENGLIIGRPEHLASYTFACNDGYSLFGDSEVFCIDGQYSASIPVCYSDCKASISIINGQYTGSFTHGGSITFTCDVGYTLVGETTITCENGQYSSSIAVCQANCDPVITIVNGQYTGSFNHGGTITFTCDVGYTLVGETTVTCENGQYSSSFAVCRANCDSFISIVNGQYTGSFTHGGSITFTCDVDYTLVGESTITCDNGQYSSSYAVCKANCDQPPVIPNGAVSTDMSHKGIVIITCKEGYTLVGVSRTVCLDGEYKDEFPVCYGDCDASISIINGQYTGSFTHGGSITFTCDVGYTLVGETTITCENGQYSSSIAVCRANCESSISIVNGQYTGSFTHGGSITFTCDVGYTLIGESTITCKNGQYNSSYAECKANCESSISIVNGQYTGSFTHGGSITFTCDVDYTLVGESTITCDNGQYSSSYAECKANCQPIVDFANGNFSGSFVHDGRVKFTCNDGYRLTGRKKLICNDGKYNDDIPVCYADCQRVELTNGAVNLKIKHGSTTTFSCHDGYTLVGASSTVCENGQFRDQPPICSGNCDPSITITNGQYTGSFTHGGSITFTCDVGYTLVGETTITCENGQYSSSIAVCRRDCGQHAPLENGLMTGEFRHSDSVLFYCLGGYSLVGANMATCRDGQFIYASGLSEPACYANCNDVPVLDNGQVIYSDTVHGSSLQYECIDGYSLVGADSSVCENGNYVITSAESDPQCFANCETIPGLPNGQLEGSFDHGGRVRFTCNSNYTLVGRKKVDCKDGQYNGEIPSCFKNCESPPDLNNGKVDADLKHGGEAKFECISGYSLIGAAKTTCQDGQYGELNQQCFGNCDASFTIANGRYSGNFQHGGSIEITCEFGYTLIGSRTITCDNGQLSSTDTQCIADCFTLPLLENGSVEGNSSHGSVILFECNDGYTLVGGTFAECDAGNFVYEGGLFPTCYANCLTEPTLEFGSISSSPNNHGSAVDYKCNDGYLLVGSKYSTCQDGVYVLENKKKEPICYANCDPIFDLPNGLVTATTFEHDGRVRFSCFEGYTLVGRKKLACVDGKYNDDIPVCYANCAVTPIVPNGDVGRTSEVHGSSIDISCDSGYSLTGASSAICNNGSYEYPPDELKPACYALCTSLPRLEYGMVSGSLVHNGKAFFSCTDGYELVGDSSVTCIDGEFKFADNATLPGCYANCDPNEVALQNGQHAGALRHGSVVTLTCDGGYTLVGSNSARCVDGSLTVELPVCYADCESFGPISDAVITGETTHNETVYISCNSGFSLVGSPTATCFDGSFDVDVDDIGCFENCESIESFANGYINGSSEHGESLKFSCLPGYSLVGAEVLACNDGLYDYALPSCTDNCDEIKSISNGEVSGSFEHGGVLEFRCDDGYILVGSPILSCTDGVYNTASPVCRANCQPIEITNGRVIGGNNHGDRVRFKCEIGFSIVGRKTLSCRDGAYSGEPPVCYADCSTPSIIPYSDFEGSTSHGSLLYYRCIQGYTGVGINHTVCDDGKYEDFDFSCKKHCEYPASLGNGTVQADVTHGGQATFRCSPGFTLVGVNVTTCNDGQYEDPNPECFQNCDIPEIPNSEITGSTDHGQNLEVSCGDSFTLVGEPILTCLGGFFEKGAICSPNCVEPAPITNGQRTSDVTHGGSTVFSCDDGYTPIGFLELKCEFGAYLNKPPTCHKNCNSSLVIANGEYTGSFDHGGTVNITCDDGYTAVGRTSITCDDGEFNHQPAKCKQNCEPLTEIVNGQFTTGFNHGNTVSITCDDGYSIVGKKKVKCVDGSYNAEFGICQADCGKPEALLNGDVQGNFKHNGKVTFTCYPGYTLVGAGDTVCKNGQYLDPNPVCYENCDSSLVIRNGRYIGSVKHEGTIYITCDAGFTLDGEANITCSNGQFSSEISVCRGDCGQPSELIDGTIIADLNHGGVTTFSCNEGYTLVGAESSVCLNGVHSNPTPECFANCASDNIIRNGQLTGSLNHGENATFSCNAGYTLVGKERVSCDDGQYSSKLAQCKLNCLDEGKLENGYVKSDITHGGKTTYSCYDNYSLVGSDFTYCEDGTYTNPRPICYANCEASVSIVNGQYTGSFTHGGSITFTCDVGYTLVGETTITCENGQYSSSYAVCRANCDSSTSVQNGQIFGSFIHGGSVNIRCDVGFTLVGDSTVTCTDGQFSSAIAECRADCVASISIVNGQYTGSFTHGGSITFTCDVGYTLVGETTITCENGQYSSSYAVCRANCDSSTSVQNGQIFGSFIHGGSVNIRCDVGFTLVGDSTVTCTDGQFSSAIAECRADCVASISIVNGQYTGSFTHGGSITFTCDVGYTLVGETTITCENGQYSSSYAVCRANCDSSTSVQNGQIFGSFIHGGSVNIRCDVGFTLVGDSTVTCTDGQFSSAIAECRADCVASISIVNGQYTGSFTHGGSITFTCDVGYTLVGETTITCENGQYSSSYAVCRANCDSSTSVQNGQIFGSFIHGGSVNIRCDVGFTLVGDSTVTCTDGQFSSAIAECRADCVASISIVNGKYTGSFTHGGSITFTCDVGYTLVGETTITCENGQYSSSYAVCRANCDSSTSVQNGQIFGSFIHGGSVNIRCDVGFTLVGDSTVTCTDGQFSSAIAECRANCEASISIVNGQYTGSFTHGGSITFTCDVGYTLVGETTITCEDGQYSSSYAVCRANCDSSFSVQNGQVFGSFIHGGSINIRCDVNYTLVGDSTVTCNNGQFSSAIVECRENCKAPPLVVNAKVEGDPSHGGGTTITCRDGYTLIGVSHTVCLDGQYQDEFPNCYGNCAASISIVNGQYTGSFTHGGSITFTCDVGYTLVGETTITCENGQYSSSYAVCRANCLPLFDIENGRIEGRSNHNDRVTVICDNGFTLVGQQQATCVDGLYSNALGVCRADCVASISIINGQYTGSFTHGGSITFTCDVGYTLVGETTITCENGQYSSSYAVCKANCGAPPIIFNAKVKGDPSHGANCESSISITNGQYTGSFTHGGSITFTCDVGYTLVGETTITCENGQYSSSYAVCRANCESSISIINGQYTGSFTHGGSITFTCDVGYTLVGETTITCENGQYSSSYAVCRANCFPLSTIQNGILDGGFHHSDSVRVICNDGFTLVGEQSSTCNDGLYSNALGVCKANCDSSISVQNGQIFGSFIHGGSFNIVCDVNYTLVGESTVTCNNGLFSSAIAECRLNCQNPSAVQNGVITTDLNHGGITTITCVAGYTLVGVASTLCLDGQFQDAFPVCYGNCSPLINIENGVFIGGFNHGDSVTVICNVGFSMVGERTVTCNDGSYSSAFAACRADCAPIEPLANVVMTGSFEHGGVIGFSCEVGYTLVGKAQINCANGVYSDVVAECHADCQSPPLVINGLFNGTINHGGIIRYECFDGFKLIGNEYLTCMDGIYLEEPPRCIGKCQPLRAPTGGFVVGTYEHNTTVEFVCHEGFTLSGVQSVLCFNQQYNFPNGQFLLPTCYADCQDPGDPLAGFRHSSSLIHDGIIHYGCRSGFTLVGSEVLLCQEGQWNATIPQCSPCDEGATYFNGSCYSLQYKRNYYDLAEAACEVKGGHLATFTTHQELMAIKTDALFGLRFYIGVKAQADKWGRETSEESSYFNWPEHNCAYHTTGNINRWNNLLPCTDKKQFICETPRPCFSDIRCLSKSIQYNGHCYQVQDINTRSWNDAHKYCQSFNGNLVVISDLEEQKAVNELLNECGPFPENQFWVGLSRESTETEWTWVTPSVAYDFKYWPDFRCAYILSQDPALPWYYSTCDDYRFSAICQNSAALYDDIFNPCDNSPCVDGGTCFAKVTEDLTDYYCDCPTGLEGKNCEKQDGCDGFRCTNNKCIQCMFTCDLIDNCGDNSDEGCRGQLTKCDGP